MPVCAAPVTGWQKDTSFGGGSGAALTGANTSSPVLGSGAANNADNTAIYAPFPLVMLANGQRITLTGTVQLIGTSPGGDFRWGIFKDDGVAPAHAGWLGYIASAESFLWSKDPSGASFSTTTFASVASGRGAQIGQASEPDGLPFNAGTYDFRMDVDRFGSEVEIGHSIKAVGGGFAIHNAAVTERNPTRITTSFDRVGFLAGGALDADQLRFSAIEFSVTPIPALTLRVHSSGQVFLNNGTAQLIDFMHYEIASESGALDRNSWISLDDQENNDPIGVGWEEAGGSGPNVIAEANLSSVAPVGPGQSLRLGSAMAAGAAHDLVFRFTSPEGDILRGPVEYVQSGDFNGDGSVDTADFIAWRKQLGASVPYGSAADGDGNGIVEPADFYVWRTNFGRTIGAAAMQSASIPEPAAIALILVALGIVAGSRYRYGRRTFVLACVLCLVGPRDIPAEEVNQVAGQLITLNTNGAWSWYMDERVIVDTVAGKILASSVADASGTGGAARDGDIDIVSYDINTGLSNHFVLHDNLQADDHNGAAIMVRPDGRYLAVYTRHNSDKLSHYRVSTNPHDATSWGPPQAFDWSTTPGSDFNATYSNLFYLAAENRTYNFARANNRSPNMMLSSDGGSSWNYGGKLLSTSVNVGYVNGYLKYASNGVDRIDFIATEHHPRDFNNNIYHGYIKGGQMFRSNGTLLDSNIFDNSAPNQTALTKVFASDPENGSQVYTRAWTTDLHLDSGGNPYAIFTTRANDVPVNTNGYSDHRFFYARYDGSQWHVHQLAKAGARLYTSEQDYTGLVALDPRDPNSLYMSTTIDPRNNANLNMHEIFKGVTGDGGSTWSWSPITFNSKMDNLRPTVPIWDASHTSLVWMRGTYRSMHDYDLDIVGLTSFGPLQGRVIGDLNGDGLVDIENDFALYIAAMYTNLTGLSADQAYAKGDLNGDFRNDAKDFVIFRQAFDDLHGLGAFDSAHTGLPEPSAAGLALIGATILIVSGRMRASEASRRVRPVRPGGINPPAAA